MKSCKDCRHCEYRQKRAHTREGTETIVYLWCKKQGMETKEHWRCSEVDKSIVEETKSEEIVYVE